LNADGSSYLTVASGGSVQLTGVEVTGNTPISGTFNDGSTVSVSGVTVTGNTSATGVYDDGSTFNVSGVEVTGATSASGTYNDGSVFTVSGCTVNDDDGNTYNLNDGESQNIYRCRNSVRLNGTTQYITIPYDAGYNIGTSSDWSLSIWVYIDNLVGVRDVFSCGTVTENVRFWYQNTNNKIQFQFRDSAGNFLQTRYDPPATNQWVHFTITKSAGLDANTINLYNGTTNLTPIVFLDNLVNAVDPTQRLAFGVTDWGPANFLACNLCEIRIFDKELSSAEVAALHNSGTPTNRTDEVGHWFKEDSTDDLVASNNATLFNSPNYRTARP
jgi:hypothetical protein